MSIKSLFNNKTKTFESAISGSKHIESKDLALTTNKRNETFYPFIDFSSASNFAKFGSAEEYYNNSIERIYDNYPYDGSENEKLQFELSSSYLDKYIFEQRYPKTNGHIKISGPSAGGTKTQGFGTNPTPEYIYVRGGLHVADNMTTKPLQQTFDKSVVYDAAKRRVSSLRMNIPQGLTTEFWLKKEAFDNSRTEKEIIVDLWNGELSSSANYGRFTLALSGTATGTDTFIVTMQSGTTGFYEEAIGTATVTTSSLADWHHYALSFVSASTGTTSRLYIDGDLNESKSLGSAGIDEIRGLINGYIGALQTAPSGNVFHGVNLVAAGTLSASLDDFRYWKTRRSSEEIYNNWYRHVGGGTNTDDANTLLGIYYKFNEGIVGNTAIDSVVLDYSGRLANGTWTGYSDGARLTSSAFVESGLLASEPKDPIIYSAHPDVAALKTELASAGKKHDVENPALLYTKIPQWIREEDQVSGKATKYLFQIIASYFDTLHSQITALPSLKNKVYPSSSYKPLPFADRLLEEKGLVVPDLFIDANVLEAFGDRDLNQVQYEEKIVDIKNQIYTNIYNNLEDIFKQKGTESSIRNMLRCFGIDDEIVKLNIYTDHGKHYFTDAFKHTVSNKKFINFNRETHLDATLFQTSSTNHSLTYISGSGAEKLEQYNAFTSEVSIMIPSKIKFPADGYFVTPFQSASVFGMHQALESSADYTWASPDTANFQVYLVRDELESSTAKFVLKDYAGTFSLETPFYKEIYSNELWNLAVSVKPVDYPIAGNVITASNRTYQLEFYGVNHAFDTVKNEFSLTQSLNYANGSSYLSNAKRFFIGAHRTNFTGSVLEQTDLKIGRFNLWYDYLSDETIKLHNLDVGGKGNKKASRASTIFGKDLSQVEVPSYELLTADWDFETVTTSDGSGEFIVIDASSGSLDNRYGWMDKIIRREHRAKGFGFPNSSTSVVDNEIVYSSKKELPEISYSSDRVTIEGEEQEFFIEDEDVSDNFYSLEKSMYQVISEEMLRSLSTIQEMSNLMGEAIDRYRINYKKLDLVRRLFFEDVEADPDFDRFSEYFKWIDSSVSFMVSQLFPVSVRFSKGISDVVESHIFERNKYQSKFPLTSIHTATEGRVKGVGELKYKWQFGHAPIEGGDNNNCVWQKERKERTQEARESIRKVIVNDNNAQPTVLGNQDRTSYFGSTYAIRRFTNTYRVGSTISQTIHPGINYNLQKNRDYIWNAVNRGSRLTSLGIPVNVLIVGAGPGQGIELPANTCSDVEVPNEKKKFNTTVFVGKFAGGGNGGTFAPINDSASYNYALKGAHNLPFDIFSGTIGGYNSSFASGYRSGAYVTNIHSDTTDFSNDVPLQGPFTNQWVGGHQSRHIDLNRFDPTLNDDDIGGPTPNNLHNQYTRAEGWLLRFVENDGGDSDGAFGIVDPQYGVTRATNKYPDAAKKSAVLYRDGRTKRAFNISNIQTTTSSINHGNYYKNYEIISAGTNKQQNNLFFRKYVNTHTFVPSEIGEILPATTNYQTLIGITNTPSGNVFGIGDSNILNDRPEVLFPETNASIKFFLDEVSDITADSGTSLEITGGGVTHLTEVNDPHNAIAFPTANLILRTGSLGLAFRAPQNPTFTNSNRANNNAYSGFTNTVSLSFWLYTGDVGAGCESKILWMAGANDRHRVLFTQTKIQVIYFNTGGGFGTATFSTDIGSESDQWQHFVIHFNTQDLTKPSFVPRVWKNGTEISGTGYGAPGGTAPSIDRLHLRLDQEMGFQDVVVWNKLLTQEDINILYANGNWNNPKTHPSSSQIIDWYKYGYEDYWATLGSYSSGNALTTHGSPTYTISSSFGTGNNDLQIDSNYDQDFFFTTGNNPFGPAKSNTVFFNELSSSLSSSFTSWQVSYREVPFPPSTTLGFFSLVQYTGSNVTVAATETRTDFSNLIVTPFTPDQFETGYLNTTTKITSSVTKTIISSRFSAPGSIDTLSYGFLDAYSQEFSVYNNLNYRNMSVRGIAVRVSASADGSDFYNFGGSGEAGTIRVNDHRSARDGLKALLSRHSGKFGIDPRYASELGSEPLEQANPDPSFHKQQRNESKRPSDTSTVLAPVFVKRYDNMYISSPIPRSDFQYKWITSTLGSNYSITSGKQRMYGYADPTGILSSSVVIDGDSGFVPAITFPTASEIFGV
tara:strand:+ start:9209 stop:15685 length:6477 start_codon:yes stop_codon:yes gene_type:complete